MAIGHKMRDPAWTPEPVSPLNLEQWWPLVTYLAKCEQHVRSGGDQLQASFASLKAITDFAEFHPNIRNDGLTRSLNVLLRLLSDIMKGKKPDLIFNRQPPTERTSDRPKDGTTVAPKAAAGACLELLIRFEFTKSEALKIVVEKLKQYGIKYTHNSEQGPVSIDAKQVERWRYEMRETMGTSPAGCMFKQMLRVQDVLEGTPAREKAIALVDEAIRGLRDQGF